MFLMYYEVEGKRVYTFAKTDPNGNPTKSAHPGEYFCLISGQSLNGKRY